MKANCLITENLSGVLDKINVATKAAGRPPGSVDLIAVSKTHSASAIDAAIAAGQKIFGENKVQEVSAKWPALKDKHLESRLHFIGALQSNKVREAVRFCDVIETVDRPKLARSLARSMDEGGQRPSCLIQVNTGEEPQKSGVLPADADAFIAACRDEFELPVAGLMCIPPADEEPALHFSFLHAIAERNGLATLSMGMSADYEIAIKFGATHVRVGTAIFGTRSSPEFGAVKPLSSD
ncbi:MAG: YggS family pyridoxal phosphate-dependent enzyme [Rhodospirillaceae bacterium]|nr:YggS family pyridoxal phosphate-dependent enzyme [Rhodospirillaceae bacterium]